MDTKYRGGKKGKNGEYEPAQTVLQALGSLSWSLSE
jgi:hypothetical protein